MSCHCLGSFFPHPLPYVLKAGKANCQPQQNTTSPLMLSLRELLLQSVQLSSGCRGPRDFTRAWLIYLCVTLSGFSPRQVKYTTNHVIKYGTICHICNISKQCHLPHKWEREVCFFKSSQEWLCSLYSKAVLWQDPFLAWLTVLFGEHSPQSIRAGRETSGRFAVGIEDVQWINVNYDCLKLNFTEVGCSAHGQN